jgi:hypothetical protein
MKLNRTQIWIGAAIIVLSSVFSAGAPLSSTAQAQGRNDNPDYNRRPRNWDGYPNLGGSFELRQTALNAGYNEGMKDGRKDREKRKRLDYSAQKTYQQATKDYSSKLGDRELYRRYFREAYHNGYNVEAYQGIQAPDDRYNNDPYRDNSRDNNQNPNYNNNRDRNRRGRNWDGYPNLGGSFDLRQTALNAGYNEGIKVGRNDRKQRRNSDYRNSSAYQKATKDYSSRLGDMELYKRYYRAGYENGYDAGYNGY